MWIVLIPVVSTTVVRKTEREKEKGKQTGDLVLQIYPKNILGVNVKRLEELLAAGMNPHHYLPSPFLTYS